MAIFREALMDYLLSKAAITSIVSADGVYGYLAPADAPLPFIVVTRIGGGTWRNLGGQSGDKEEFWQVSAFAKSDLQCEELAEEIITALDLMQPTTMSPDGGLTDYTVHNSHLEDGGIGSDIENHDRDGSESKVVQKPLTFRILRTRTAT